MRSSADECGGRKRWNKALIHGRACGGLLLAVLIIVVALTGAALVLHDAFHALEPERHGVSGQRLLSPERYVAAARARAAVGARVAVLTLPDAGRRTVMVTMTTASGADAARQDGSSTRATVFLDPPTARVLDVADDTAGPVHALRVVHASLMLSDVGRGMVGVVGIATMVSCIAALWRWRPSVRRRRNGGSRLYRLTGVVGALSLFVASATGAWISFSAHTGALELRNVDLGIVRAPPLDAPALSVAQVVARARPLVPEARLLTITWPTERVFDWRLRYATKPALSVMVADDSGAVAVERPRGGAKVAGWVRRIHDGSEAGWLWRALVFLGGVLPAVLGAMRLLSRWRTRDQ